MQVLDIYGLLEIPRDHTWYRFSNQQNPKLTQMQLGCGA
jgi:hypothetical protein